MIVSLLILTLIGIRDDLKNNSLCRKNCFFQIIAISIMLYFNPHLLVDNLYGFFRDLHHSY